MGLLVGGAQSGPQTTCKRVYLRALCSLVMLLSLSEPQFPHLENEKEVVGMIGGNAGCAAPSPAWHSVRQENRRNYLLTEFS